MRKYTEVEMVKSVKVDNVKVDENEMAKHVKNKTLKRIMSVEEIKDYFPYFCVL